MHQRTDENEREEFLKISPKEGKNRLTKKEFLQTYPKPRKERFKYNNFYKFLQELEKKDSKQFLKISPRARNEKVRKERLCPLIRFFFKLKTSTRIFHLLCLFI